MTRAQPLFAHVAALTDTTGLFEHALLHSPRPEHGYCVDDVARALVALARDEDRTDPGEWATLPAEVGARLAAVYCGFLERAQEADGRVVNRVDVHRTPHGAPALDDSWGRALWAFGTATARSRDPELAGRCDGRFTAGAWRRSPWPRAMAFAGLGAAEVMRISPWRQDARLLLADAAASIGTVDAGADWPWPEPRLTYANAVLPDVLLAAGDSLGEDRLVARGLELLSWLLDLQTRDGHLSLVPAAGWRAPEPLPAFDQQPIEAATLADACARAYELTGDARWARAVEHCAAWFFGSNDSGTCLYDPATGGCGDGLEAHGRNENQGAESALALVTTVQHASRLALARA